MKFFGSSLDIRDNLKAAFLEKNPSKVNCATFISGNQYDRLNHQNFLEAAASLSNRSRKKSINTTEESTRSKCSLQ